MTRCPHRWLPLLSVLLLGTPCAGDRFTIRCDWFDRGNVDAGGVARGYADKFPCIVNGGKTPNQAEYDLDFPVTADYTIWALYAAVQSRPVDIYLDGKKLVRGFTKVTGSWQTSRARWFEQCTARITKGRHTVKLLCPGPCIPHICALRFESSEPFPKGWRLARRKPRRRPGGRLAERMLLSPARLHKMLGHVARLIARFRQMEGVVREARR